MFRFRVLHFFLLGLFVLAKICKWAIFGTLTDNEVAILKGKAGYTVWEFVIGFLVFYNSCGNFLDVYTESCKYAGLFLCVLLLKFFHYLIADRVHTTYFGADNAAGSIGIKVAYLRLGLGLLLLNLVDALLIYKYLYDVILRNYIQHNVLISLFGYEILTHYPTTLSTTILFSLNMYEVAFVSQAQLWKHQKLRIIFIAEFIFNMLRLGMSCVFSMLFLYYYTFPFHIVPSSYSSLKVAVAKTRTLVEFRKRELILRKLSDPAPSLSGTCIICYETFQNGTLVKTVPSCDHSFHYECLQLWLAYSPSCPICRSPI